MPKRNEYCLDELRSHLGRDEPLAKLQATLLEALEMGKANDVVSFNISGTANQLEAELVDLVEKMAAGYRSEAHVGGKKGANALLLSQRELLRAG